MMDDHNHGAEAFRNLAVDLLRRVTPRTPEKIREAAETGARAALAVGISVDVEALTAELRHLFSVEIDDATILDDDDPRSHTPWLEGRKAEIQWSFWRRYMNYLERDFGMAPASVNALDALTDMVVGRLEDPRRDGPWDRRGMVVGSVQSGKTANYTGLICKALDSGYKLIIVLAGIHSNLRSQTQLRIDEGVLGFDTQKSRRLNKDSQWIGVGRLPGAVLHIHSLTSSAEDGDFNKRVAESAGIMLGSDPVVLVVKKNSRLLGNLLKWVLHVAGSDNPRTGRRLIRDVPLLLIDDEADNASIDTGKKRAAGPDPDTVTAINGKIRELLSSFEKAAYVGYTATPFANIFVNPEAQTEKHGDDIFPRSFIVNVKPPSNYIGPSRVFGLAGDPDAGIAGEDGLPIIIQIDDYAAPSCFPVHKKDHVPTELPASLKRAIRCYILACAARRARGQANKHNSMLVHVTRYTNVQDKVVGLVRDELLPLQRRLQFGDGARLPGLLDELRDLWNDEFVPRSRAMGADAGLSLTWDQLEAALNPAASKIQVMTINGSAREVLDYKAHEAEGLSVIAVGGDKLSRGLTLEGLSVSYFLRTSRMYDTLMQMGRWFGYRPGYLDLCRLFTTQQLVRWYRHIALAEVELRREFDYMVNTGRTPLEYGLRVRTHPDGMIVTALNKMCHTQSLKLSWAGVLVQSTHLPRDGTRVGANLSATDRLVRSLGVPVENEPRETRVWREVPANLVADYLEELQLPPEAARAGGRQVADFIRKQATKEPPELTSWTVVLKSISQKDQVPLGGYDVGLVQRTPAEGTVTSDGFALRKANIKDPPDEAIDLKYMPFSPEALASGGAQQEIADDVSRLGIGTWTTLHDLAVAITRQRVADGRLRGGTDKKVANGRVVRQLRPKTNGLLLIYPLLYPLDPPEGQASQAFADSRDPRGPIIGLAVSFPASDTVDGVEYRVNRVWNSEIEEDAAYED